MGLKTNIIKISLLALWITLGASVMLLLVAAINIKNNESCKGVKIEIRGVEKYLFLSRKDVMRLLFAREMDKPEGKAINDFDLQSMEASLRKNIWVKRAELFFDNNRVLHINILEKEPVARVFTPSGYSFYIDSSGDRLPLSEKMHARLPVFTGFPYSQRRIAHADSLLLRQISRLSRVIIKDKFWMAQIAQVDITVQKNFEMIPTVGNHIIEFGNGENPESKFRRLFLFYDQVLSGTGFDRYSRIKLQYEGQVVGVVNSR